MPEYDLRSALPASRKGIVNFYCRKDLIYLALGTLIFGTMDKQNRVSAGNPGFTDPRKSHADGPTASQASRSAGQEIYDKLHQVPWQSEMGRYGYDGTHLTIGAKRFVAAYPASLVTARQWNAGFVAQLPKAPPAACPTASDASDSAARMP